MEEHTINKKSNGNFIMTKNAFKKIVTECIEEIDGIECLTPMPYNIKDYLMKAKKPKEIEIEMSEGTIHLKVGIRAEKGESMLKLCEFSQKQIKDNLQSITGFTVSQIDIYVKELGCSKEDKV